MTTPTRRELLALARCRAFPSVSLLLPVGGRDGAGDLAALRLRGLVRQAEHLLADAGVGQARTFELLAPTRTVAAELAARSAGVRALALFASPAAAHLHRLPLAVPETVVVADRFHLLPLVPLLSEVRFLVLALAQGDVRLYAGTPEGLTPRPLPGAPHSLEEAMRLDDRDDQLQLHATGPARGGKRPVAAFHGHGVGVDDAKDRTLRFLQAVDHAVCEAVRGEQAPLVPAGVDWVVAMYRGLSRCPNLSARSISGSPEHVPLARLCEQAAAIARSTQQAAHEQTAARARRLAGTGHTVAGPDAIARAAADGRVDVLLLPAQSPLGEGGTPPESTGDRDLLNLAVVDTLTHGGTALALDRALLPERRPIAILRY